MAWGPWTNITQRVDTEFACKMSKNYVKTTYNQNRKNSKKTKNTRGPSK